jgi:hypothetical protein
MAAAIPAPSTDPKKVSQLSDYFGLKVGREFVSACFEKIDQYQSHVERSGRLSTWKRCYKNYYLGGIENAKLKSGGEKNQFVLAQVNHFSNILSHMLNNVTNQRPALKARASNSDFKSLAQTKIADQVLEYFLDEKDLEIFQKNAAELSLIFGEGFVEEIWDATLGNEVTAESDEATGEQTGNVVNEGDVTFDFYAPMDVIRDFSMGSPDKCIWHITRKWVNRWELAAKYPQYETEILSATTSSSSMRKQRIGHAIFETENDQMALYSFIHQKGNVLKEGRLAQFIENEDVILTDGPLPHKQILHRISPQEQHGTIWGYTKANDLLPIQENLNMLYSIIASNQAMFGVQSLLVAKGSGIEYSSLQGGLRIVEYDAKPGVDSKPSALQLTSTPPEIFNHIQHLIQQMETISGVNSVVRGQPEASLESGAALALVASQSIQFLSSFQQAYTALLESTGTGLIDILKNYANEPRLMSLAGKNNTQYVKEFVGSQIDQIDRVVVEVGNPLSRTTSGKLQIAQDLLKNNLVPDAKQYLQIIETGTIEPLTEGMTSQLMLVKDENERLSKGEKIPALRTDQHMLHVQEHASVLSNIEARLNPQVVDAVDDHIRQHESLLQQLTPILAGATNQPVLNQGAPGGPPGGAPPGAPHGPPGAPPPGGPPHGGSGAAGVTGPPPGIMQQAAAVKPPTNPLSHQPFNPTTGGM